MTDSIHSFIKKNNLLSDNATVVIGLSGGPDSMFLLHFLAQLHNQKKISLVAAHLDHQWRANSGDDVLFCQQAAATLNIPFVHAQASAILPQPKKNGSQEALGRKLRRTFLENVARTHGAQAIALAHHAQDQEETFFIRLIRGTTLSGLVGMQPKHGLYIRPLLETKKEEILNYLHERGISYLTDPTNSSEEYLRNKIRLKALPELQKADARFSHNFLRTLQQLQEAETTLAHLTEKLFEETTEVVDGRHHLELKRFFAHNQYLQKRILMQWLILERAPFVPTERFLDEIIRFLTDEKKGKHALHPSWALIKEKNFAYLSKQ